MKFFKNLALWWGWMSYKKVVLSCLIWLFLTLVLFVLPWLWPVSRKTMNNINYFGGWYLFCLASQIATVILGQHFSKISRNWRVAVAEAEKMAEYPEYEFARHMLWNYIQSARLNKSGKDLTRIIQLLRKHHELNAQLESFEQERNRLDIEHDKVLNERNNMAKELNRLFS